MAAKIITLVTSRLFLPESKDNRLTDSIPQNAVGLFFVYSGTYCSAKLAFHCIFQYTIPKVNSAKEHKSP